MVKTDIFQNNSIYSQVIGMLSNWLLQWVMNNDRTASDWLINQMIRPLGGVVMLFTC